MIRLLTSILLLFLPFEIFSQNKIVNIIDSLYVVVQNSKGDEQINAYIEYIWEYRNINPLVSIKHAPKIFELLKQNPNQQFEGTLNNVLGVIHTFIGNYDVALSYHLKSLKIREKANDKRSIAASYNNLALVYQEAKNYDKALEYYFKSLSIKNELGNKVAIGLTLNNIGGIYRLQKNYNKSLEYHEKAFLLVKQMNNNEVLSLTYQGMGQVYSALGNHVLAIEFFQTSLKLLESIGNIQGTSKILNALANEYYMNNDVDNAKYVLTKSVAIAEKMDMKPQLVDAYQLLSQIFAKNNDFVNAYKYSLLYTNVHNKLFNSEQNKHLVNIQMQYETEKQANKIKTLELEQQRSIRNILILVVSVFLLTGIIAFQRFRYGLKTNKNLELRNKKIETLYKIGEAVNGTKDIKEFYSIIHDTISQLMNAKNFYIAIYDDEKQTIEYPYFIDEYDTDSHLQEFEAQKFGKGITEYLILQKKSLLLTKSKINDLGKEGIIDLIGTIPEFWLGVPLFAENFKPIGAMVVQTYSKDVSYNKSEQEILEFVSNHLAIAIEKKKTQYLIYESEQKFRMLADNIPAIIYLCKNDSQYTMLYLNEKIKSITGYSQSLFLTEKLSFVDLYHPDDVQMIFNTVDEAIKDKKPYHFEFRMKTKDGSYVWLEEFGAALDQNPNTEEIMLEGVIFDITQRKFDEERLVLAKEQAEKSDKLKSEFLAQMSHEIRTPVNTLLSFSSLLRDELEDSVDEDLKASFVSMANAGRRIIRTIDLILNMSEVTAGIYDYVSKYFDITKELLDPVRNEYQFIAAEKGLEFCININTDNLFVWADEYTVGQIINNLVDNAIKYTQSGSININIYRTRENRLIVEVQDTGIGISSEYLPMLFQTFSQEEQGYTRKFEGNGLGLALVKKYCELNNADIEVESEKGVGTTFRIIFS